MKEVRKKKLGTLRSEGWKVRNLRSEGKVIGSQHEVTRKWLVGVCYNFPDCYHQMSKVGVRSWEIWGPDMTAAFDTVGGGWGSIISISTLRLYACNIAQ